MIIIIFTFHSGLFSTATLPRLIKHSGLRPRVHEVVAALNNEDEDDDHDDHHHHVHHQQH